MSLSIDTYKNWVTELKGSAPAGIPSRVASYFSQLQRDSRAVELFRQVVFFHASKKPAGLALKRTVNENPPNAWEWYVRKDCKNVQRGCYGQGTDLNEHFGRTCHAAVLQQLQNLRAGQKITLRELYAAFAKVRHGLAVESGTEEAHKFGRMRVPGESNYSSLIHGLAPYVTKSQEFYLNAVKSLTPIDNPAHFLMAAIEPLHNPEQYQIYELRMNPCESPCFVIVHKNPGEEPTLTYVLTTFQNSKGTTKILSGISFSHTGWQINGMCFGMLTLANDASAPFIQHCKVEVIDDYFERAEQLFTKLIEVSDFPKDSALHCIAELDAIFDNAMLSTRGISW